MIKLHVSMEGRSLSICIIGVLLSIHLLFACPHFLHSDDAWISLVHHFFHANIFHLAVNCLSIWTLFRKGYRYAAMPIVIAYLIGTISWFFAPVDPVGISNMIFAILGLRTPSLKNAWWRQPHVIAFFAISTMMAILPQVSALTHIVSFILGCVAAGALRIINSICRDYRRATYN